jgi:Fe-S-cluster-containing hydrogenase component 2
MKVLTFNPNRCDGTRACEVACAQTWFKVADRDRSSIRISAEGDALTAAFDPMRRMHPRLPRRGPLPGTNRGSSA